MSSRQPIAIGLDLGTGGARAMAVDLAGHLVATGRADMLPSASRNAGACVEQDPLAWTAAAQAALQALMASLKVEDHIVGVAVDATSGTFLLVDDRNRPLTPGIMYNDLRAVDQAERCAEALRPSLGPYGIEIAASFALPKVLYLAETQPGVFARCRQVVHQTDWIVGMLCGRYDVTDISTALKTGADVGRLNWPEAIELRLGIPRSRLPRIVLPGVRIGEVTAEASSATGLPAGTPVVSGCTDGTAGCLASGASRPGDLNVTLGTTLVFKAVADEPVIDPIGAIYNHRHPAGGYLPGSASSTGGEWITGQFGRQTDMDALGCEAARLLPTGYTVYPLARTGERFPFACPQAKGFGLEPIAAPAERFAAGMEGVAYLERLGVERFAELGFQIADTIYATGGAVAGETWLRIRACVNRRTYVVPELPESAMGAAILAAGAFFGDCREAIRRLVRVNRRIEPDSGLAEAYETGFERFRVELQRRGYL
jgi:sugar (pentulose or hexulose) kinase